MPSRLKTQSKDPRIQLYGKKCPHKMHFLFFAVSVWLRPCTEGPYYVLDSWKHHNLGPRVDRVDQSAVCRWSWKMRDVDRQGRPRYCLLSVSGDYSDLYSNTETIRAVSDCQHMARLGHGWDQIVGKHRNPQKDPSDQYFNGVIWRVVVSCHGWIFRLNRSGLPYRKDKSFPPIISWRDLEFFDFFGWHY